MQLDQELEWIEYKLTIQIPKKMKATKPQLTVIVAYWFRYSWATVNKHLIG